MGGRNWTQAEQDVVRKMYADAPPLRLKEVAEQLGRTPAAVSIIAARMGLGDIHRRRVAELKVRLPAFSSAEELRAHQSETTKQRLKTDGHPRGMLGKKHSAPTRAAMSAASCKMWADPGAKLRDAELRERATDAMVRTKASRPPPTTNFSRAAGGRRADLEDRYFRSSWEANYARYLNWMVAQGRLQSWEYECKTFLFEGIKRGTRMYTPDFKVTHLDGRHEWHEVKGWLDQKSRTKLRRMAKYFPGEPILLIEEAWFRQAKAGGLSALLPGWESGRRGSRGC